LPCSLILYKRIGGILSDLLHAAGCLEGWPWVNTDARKVDVIYDLVCVCVMHCTKKIYPQSTEHN
jgi:hypothetical protein